MKCFPLVYLNFIGAVVPDGGIGEGGGAEREWEEGREGDFESVITMLNFPWLLLIVACRCYDVDDQNKPLSTKRLVMKAQLAEGRALFSYYIQPCFAYLKFRGKLML